MRNERAHLDLFSGIGGFSLGAEWAGFKTCAFVEINEHCQKVLGRHWPGVPIFPDVRKFYRYADEFEPCEDCGEPRCELCDVDFAECDCLGVAEYDDKFPQPELITSGTPCQPASAAGHGQRRGVEDERWLWPDTLRIVGALGPRWAVMENPTSLLTLNGGREFGGIIGELHELGFDVWWETLPARAVGAPHQRDRVFIICEKRATEQMETGGGAIHPMGGTGEKTGGHSGQLDFVPHAGGSGLEKHAGHESGPAGLGITEPDGQLAHGHLRDGANPAERWEHGPPRPRVGHGIPERVERVQAVGNSVCPQLAFEILRSLK